MAPDDRRVRPDLRIVDNFFLERKPVDNSHMTSQLAHGKDMEIEPSPRNGQTTTGMARLVRGCAALVALVVLLVGVPWLIVSWGAWPAMVELVQQPSRLLAPDDGHVFMVVLTLVGAVFWVILAVSIGLEIVTGYRAGRRTRRWSGNQRNPGLVGRGNWTAGAPSGWLRWPRSLVRPLVVAVFALTMASGLTPALADTVGGGTPPMSLVVTATASHPTGGYADSADQPAGSAMPGRAVLPTGSPQASQYVVQPGDSLWSIAERQYGDGSAWVAIAKANADLLRGSPDLIEVGWVLVLPPGGGEAGLATTIGPPATIITVKPGDSLWSIASAALGEGDRWPEIVDLNPDVIDDPNVILPGWELAVPMDSTWADTPADGTDQTGGDGTPGGDPADDRDTTETTPGWPNDQPAESTPTSPNAPADPELPAGATDPADPADSVGPSVQAELDPGPVVIGVAESESSTGQLSPGDEASIAPPSAPDADATTTADGTGHTAVVASAVGGVGLLLAGGLVLALRRRRAMQMRARPIGRRIPASTAAGHRLETALRLTSDVETAEAHQVEVSEGSAAVPVVLGRADSGGVVIADLEAMSTLAVTAGEPDDLRCAMDALCLSLASGVQSEVDVQVVTADPALFADFETVTSYTDPAVAVDRLKALVSERRCGMAGRSIDQVRQDADLADAYRSVVFCFIDPVDPGVARSVAEALTLPSVGVSALVGSLVGDTTALAGQRRLTIDASRQAHLFPSGLSLTPSLVDQHEVMSDLLAVASSLDTVPAWWSTTKLDPPSSPVEEMTMMPLPSTDNTVSAVAEFHHPTVMLLGPMALEGACGSPPPRAERSCIEYCCWLLEHPGASAVAMAQSLLVAESTRRSNMSRLRTWLGDDATGRSYLPEAYSGRIWLHEAVTSDWQRLCWLISGGIESLEADQLLDALRLVRGMPLADAAPGQWHWAEELRTDMVSVIRDLGVVAARKCLDLGRLDQARWATNRALLAAPDDETLLVTRIEVEYAAGNRTEVERLAGWVTRNARSIGIDLLPESAAVLRAVLSSPRPARPFGVGALAGAAVVGPPEPVAITTEADALSDTIERGAGDLTEVVEDLGEVTEVVEDLGDGTEVVGALGGDRTEVADDFDGEVTPELD